MVPRVARMVLGTFTTWGCFLPPPHPQQCYWRPFRDDAWLRPWGEEISAALKIKTGPMASSSKSLQEPLVLELGSLQDSLFGGNTIVIKSAFGFVYVKLIEPELRKHQLRWLGPYFFHIPLVNTLKVRWLILCLTRKDGSFSQMLLPAESGLVHSLRESLNHRLLAGRQTLADSHLWPTMKRHLLWLGEERFQQVRAIVEPFSCFNSGPPLGCPKRKPILYS